MTLLTVAEVAAWMRVSKVQIRKNIHEGRLRAIQPANVFRIDIKDLRAWSGIEVTVEDVLSASRVAGAESEVTK